jgi:hypothetical protein
VNSTNLVRMESRRSLRNVPTSLSQALKGEGPEKESTTFTFRPEKQETVR